MARGAEGDPFLFVIVATQCRPGVSAAGSEPSIAPRTLQLNSTIRTNGSRVVVHDPGHVQLVSEWTDPLAGRGIDTGGVEVMPVPRDVICPQKPPLQLHRVAEGPLVNR